MSLKLNGVIVDPTIFPDGTSQVWKLKAPIYAMNTIDWVFESESEVMHLAQLKDLIDAHGAKTELVMKYLPYGRQDKPISNDASFALRTFAKIINNMNFIRVTTLDAHSYVAQACINNLENTNNNSRIRTTLSGFNYTKVAYPDKGARDRYHITSDYVYANKKRNQLTGEIESLEIVGDVAGQDVLIVDDICDGGATFIQLTKRLKELGAKRVGLYVTHGIFSKGTQVLYDAGIDKIFTDTRHPKYVIKENG